MTSLKRYSPNHINIVHGFFSTRPYERTSGKTQHIRNIASVDKLKVVGYAFKQLILTNPFNGEENWIVFILKKVTILNINPQEGINFFEAFFENYRFCPMVEFSVLEKKIFENIVSEQEIWVARTVVRKKLI